MYFIFKLFVCAFIICASIELLYFEEKHEDNIIKFFKKEFNL